VAGGGKDQGDAARFLLWISCLRGSSPRNEMVCGSICSVHPGADDVSTILRESASRFEHAVNIGIAAVIGQWRHLHR